MRYNEDCIQQLLDVVTYLDPQYKNLPYLNDSEKKSITGSWINADESCESSRSQGSWGQYWINIKAWQWRHTTKKKKRPGPLTKLLGDIFTSKKHCEKNTIDHAKNELVRYEAEETLHLDDIPLEWWTEKENSILYYLTFLVNYFHYQLLVFFLKEFLTVLVMWSLKSKVDYLHKCWSTCVLYKNQEIWSQKCIFCYLKINVIKVTIIIVLISWYRIAQNFGRENFGKFGKTIVIRQCFTQPNSPFTISL